MKTTDNHIFIGKEDKLNNWAGHKDVDRDELTEEEMGKLTKKVKELIKNYLQLDNVNFLLVQALPYILGLPAFKIFHQRQRSIFWI